MAKTESELLPCPFCGSPADPEGWSSIDRKGPACTNGKCNGAADSADAWNRRAASSDGGVEPVAFVGDYLKSDGSYDYYVMLRSGGREMSLHMHRIRGRAEYEAAEINSLFNGNEKPDFDDFDVDGPPANAHSPAKALDGIAVTDDMVGRASEILPRYSRSAIRAALTAALK